jgi:hypothetical protein
MRVCVCLRVQLMHKDPHRKRNCKRRLGDASDKMHRAQRDMHIVPFCVPTAPTETCDAKGDNLHVMPLATSQLES